MAFYLAGSDISRAGLIESAVLNFLKAFVVFKLKAHRPIITDNRRENISAFFIVMILGCCF